MSIEEIKKLSLTEKHALIQVFSHSSNRKLTRWLYHLIDAETDFMLGKFNREYSSYEEKTVNKILEAFINGVKLYIENNIEVKSIVKTKYGHYKLYCGEKTKSEFVILDEYRLEFLALQLENPL